MGGVATLVDAKNKDSFVNISEGENNDEVRVRDTQISNTHWILSMWHPKCEVQDRWGRILNEVKKLNREMSYPW